MLQINRKKKYFDMLMYWREKSGEKFRGNDWSIHFKAWIGVQSLYIITILKHDYSA